MLYLRASNAPTRMQEPLAAPKAERLHTILRCLRSFIERR